MYRPHIQPLVSLLILIISFTCYSGVAATNVTTNATNATKPANITITNHINYTFLPFYPFNPYRPPNNTVIPVSHRPTVPSDYDGYDEETFCYVCRSDQNPECRNNVEQYEGTLGKACSLEEVEKFNRELASNPPMHPLPKYDNTLFNKRSGGWKGQFSCYTLISSDALYVHRTCVPRLPNQSTIRQGGPCNTRKGSKGRQARCYTCNGDFCNTQRAGASHISPPVFQDLVCVNLLLLLMSGKMVDLTLFQF